MISDHPYPPCLSSSSRRLQIDVAADRKINRKKHVRVKPADQIDDQKFCKRMLFRLTDLSSTSVVTPEHARPTDSYQGPNFRDEAQPLDTVPVRRSLARTRPAYTARMSELTIKALALETFGDFVALVERNKGMFASCWCVQFHPDCAEKGQSAEGNRALKQRLVADGIAHAALVYDGDRAVAWAEYGSPEELPRIHHRKEYIATAERLPDYRITCILVERGLRGQGLAAIAPHGAVELIAQAGGGLVEGYPHDTGGLRQKNSSFLIQRHPHDVRARGLHIRPAQGPG